MALRQKDIKRMLAFSTLAQVGEIALMLGLGAWISVAGGLGHVVNHAIMKNLLFLAAGGFILRVGSQNIAALSGIGRKMPVTGACFLIGALSIMGLPPFNGFTSKFLMLHAAVQSGAIWAAVAILAASVVGAIYYSRLIMTLFFQPCSVSSTVEAPLSMRLGMMAFAAACLAFGLLPELWLEPVRLAADAALGVSAANALPNLTIVWPVAALIPLGGVVLIFFKRQNKTAGLIAAGASALAAVCALLFNQEAGMLSSGFALLAAATAALNFCYSSVYMGHSHAQWRFYMASLVMVSGLLGMSLSQNLFSFFGFWEIMSGWPLFFAIIHEEGRDSLNEGFKYFLFNLVGASFLFLAVLLLGHVAGSYDMTRIAEALPGLPSNEWALPMALAGAAFLMKAAMLPLRIDWQMHPPTAPTPISGYISAALLKSAPFGMLAFFFSLGTGIYQAPSMESIMYAGAWIAGLTIFFAAFKAVTQSGIKRVLIYSTVSQMGYIVLGICLGTSLGLAGGMLHLVNHMVFKNLVFLCAGALMYRTHAHTLEELGGIGRKMPVTTAAFGIGVLSVAGVPPLSGFTSKWIVYHALFEKGEALLALLALSGSVLTLAYFAKFMHSAFFGQPTAAFEAATEVAAPMRMPMLMLSGVCILTGVFPGLLLLPIAHLQSALGIAPIQAALSGIPDGPGAWNAPLMTFMLILAFGATRLILWSMSGKVRRTAIHTCGVKELEPRATHVAGDNLYEAPLQFVAHMQEAIVSFFHKRKV